MEHLLGMAILIQCARVTPPSPVEDERTRVPMVGDPAIEPVLRRVHDQPGHPWTVGSLAREAGLSRSIFAERFRTAVGVPPMRYLFDCRMRMAGARLRAGSHGIKEIALLAGYASEPAFSCAFKRWSGRAPGRWRGEPAPSTSTQPKPGRPDHLASSLTPARPLPR